MPRWVKVVLHFLKLEGAVAVRVELVKSLVDKSLSNWVQLAAEGSQKFVKADLTVTTGVEDIEESLSVTGTHAWNAVVV